MKTFAQFFNISANPDNKIPVPACGSDSVRDIDRRLSINNASAITREVCKKKGFIGFTLNKGRYSNSKEIRPLELI